MILLLVLIQMKKIFALNSVSIIIEILLLKINKIKTYNEKIKNIVLHNFLNYIIIIL